MQSDLTKEESSEQKPVDRMSTALLRTARRAGAKQRWRWRNGRRIWRDRAFGTGRVGSASATAESTHVKPCTGEVAREWGRFHSICGLRLQRH
ncbi:hypothetical protein FOFC_11725 [Fusarium oxysporum]|nr:hypothetical protein FOFC_11725 [Fusarium oxysporum]